MSSDYTGYGNDRYTPFNSSFAFLERMERRWEDCDLAKGRGDVTAYYRALEIIFRNAHPFFNDDEIAECEDYVRKIEGYITSPDKAAGVWVGENQCDRFRMLLVKLLFKYKITYHKKEKINLEDEVEDDY